MSLEPEFESGHKIINFSIATLQIQQHAVYISELDKMICIVQFSVPSVFFVHSRSILYLYAQDQRSENTLTLSLLSAGCGLPLKKGTSMWNLYDEKLKAFQILRRYISISLLSTLFQVILTYREMGTEKNEEKWGRKNEEVWH